VDFRQPQGLDGLRADTLRLYFQCDATNPPESLYVVLKDSTGHTAIVGYSDPDAVLAAE
jgi:hypothetical protein